MSKEKIISLCGQYPPGFEEVDILSNPDFIFSNDPSYDTVRLYDIDGNTVFVNSFLECQHYVKGGWDFLFTERNEIFFHNTMLIFCFLAVVVGISLSTRIFNKIND